MKKMTLIAIPAGIVVLVIVVLLCRGSSGNDHSTNDYMLIVQLSGTPGAPITGEYIRRGQRVAIAGVLPWSLSESNVTRIEIRKIKPEDILVLEARGGGSTVSGRANPGVHGIRVEMQGGWSFHSIE